MRKSVVHVKILLHDWLLHYGVPVSGFNSMLSSFIRRALKRVCDQSSNALHPLSFI